LLDLQYNVDLTPLNTMALPARAESLIVVRYQADLVAAVQYAQQHNLAITILGGGSNVIFAADVPGLMVMMKITGIQLITQGENSVVIKVGAGENWHNLVMNSLDKGWFGLENLSLIPGTVGAAPVQNIGAYGVELCDSFVELEAVDLQSGKLITLDKKACEFGYRDSVFKGRLKHSIAITTVTLKLSTIQNTQVTYPALQNELSAFADDNITPALVSDVVCRLRNSKLPDPANIPNAGSFFKNPVVSADKAQQLQAEFNDLVSYSAADGSVKLAAGWLIEQAGWKGKSRGPVAVHTEQALVLVNKGRGNGADILALANEVATAVFNKFGVSLEIEPRVLPLSASASMSFT